MKVTNWESYMVLSQTNTVNAAYNSTRMVYAYLFPPHPFRMRLAGNSFLCNCIRR